MDATRLATGHSFRAYCIATREPYDSPIIPGISRGKPRARAHFEERDLHVEFYWGIDVPRSGLVVTKPFEEDENKKIIMSQRRAGTWVSHRALWAACLLLPDEPVLLMEDDAIFPKDWKSRLEEAFHHTPEDWEMLFIGSCCTWWRPKTCISGPVYEVKWPLCLHAYFVRRHKVLDHLIRTQDACGCYAPADIAVADHSLSTLRVYTVLPRIVEQADHPNLDP
jgi:Glycosyltransferase family 25 (LPS biosynthesis protein)